MILSYLLAAFVLLYVIQITVVTLAVRRPRDEVDASAHPFISVVIAARDEEGNLAACLQSTLNQTYERQSFEVIVVNDHSTDRTESICKEFAAHFANFRYLNAREDIQLRGKTNALDQGIDEAKGEIILITDADCTVPATWVEWTAKRYTDSVGIVGGLTLQKADTWFGGMQSLDWAYILGLAATTMSLRIPLSTIGNNLSFRKAAYKHVGGYRNIPFSVTEDFMLFQAIVQTKKWDYICPIDPRLLVTSQPCSGWRELLRQKHRWGTGGLDMNLTGFCIGAIGFGLNILILVSLTLGDYVTATCSLAVKMGGELCFFSVVLRKLHQLQLLRYFLWFEAYFICYVLVLPFLVFFGGRVVWKGRTY